MMTTKCSRLTWKAAFSVAASLLIFPEVPAFAQGGGAGEPRVVAQLGGFGGLPPPPLIAPRQPQYGRDQYRRPSPRRGVPGGKQTSLIQSQLRRLGFYRGRIDGDYGPGTRAAVARFQRAYGLRPDGIAGPATTRALSRAASRRGRSDAAPLVSGIQLAASPQSLGTPIS